MNDETTAEDLIFDLWRKCLIAAREAGEVPAGAVEKLIRDSREALTERNYTENDANLILFNVYSMIHWDWKEPTDRVFETLLEFELADFLKERGFSL